MVASESGSRFKTFQYGDDLEDQTAQGDPSFFGSFVSAVKS